MLQSSKEDGDETITRMGGGGTADFGVCGSRTATAVRTRSVRTCRNAFTCGGPDPVVGQCRHRKKCGGQQRQPRRQAQSARRFFSAAEMRSMRR